MVKVRMLEKNNLYLGDCLDLMKGISDESIDMILSDLPYGISQCKWDSVIPLDSLWSQYTRIIKANGAIVLTGSEPFTSVLIMSNLKMFKYSWIWQKTSATGFFDCKKRPLNDNETISVFYKKQPIYHPQMTKAEKIYKRGYVKNKKGSDCYGSERDYLQVDTGLRYPKRIIRFRNVSQKDHVHPTQKPVALFEYLIRTYTDEKDIVLDNCIGSGTTAIACMNTGRSYIGIEKDENYFNIAQERINQRRRRNEKD